MKVVRTLQELCVAIAASNLSSDPAVKEVIFATFKHLDLSNDIKNVEESVSWHDTFLKEISYLSKDSPRMFYNNPYDLIPTISVEIMKWARFHNETFDLSYEFMKDFINYSLFTREGTIDREKVGRALFKEGSLKPSTRFKIVCYYSLSDIIGQSWLLVPDSLISKFRSHDNSAVRLWTDFLFGYYKGTNISHDLLNSAVEIGSDVSFCYHWKKSDEEAKNEAVNYFGQTFLKKLKLWDKCSKGVATIYTYEPYVNIFKFLLKVLDSEKIKALLVEHKICYGVLTYMLRWPYQSSFVDTLILVKEILSNREYHRLLLDIIEKMEDPFVGKSYDYGVLLQNFWEETPQTFKMIFFEFSPETYLQEIVFSFGIFPIFRPYGSAVLVELFKLNFTYVNKEIVRSMLGSFEVSKLQRFAETFGQNICNETIVGGNLRWADFFLECCEVDLIVFKYSLITTSKFKKTLVNLLGELKFGDIDRVLKWVLIPNEFKVFKEEFSAHVSEKSNLITESNSITIPIIEGDFNSNLVISIKDFGRIFWQWLVNKEFEKVNDFLKWVFPCEEEIYNYKVKLANSPNTDLVSDWEELKLLKKL